MQTVLCFRGTQTPALLAKALLVSRQGVRLGSREGWCCWDMDQRPEFSGMGTARAGNLRMLGRGCVPADVTLHSPPGATKEGQGPFPQTRPASVPALQDGLPWYFQAAQLFIGTRNSTPVLPQLACSFSEAHLM